MQSSPSSSAPVSLGYAAGLLGDGSKHQYPTAPGHSRTRRQLMARAVPRRRGRPGPSRSAAAGAAIPIKRHETRFVTALSRVQRSGQVSGQVGRGDAGSEAGGGPATLRHRAPRFWYDHRLHRRTQLPSRAKSCGRGVGERRPTIGPTAPPGGQALLPKHAITTPRGRRAAIVLGVRRRSRPPRVSQFFWRCRWSVGRGDTPVMGGSWTLGV